MKTKILVDEKTKSLTLYVNNTYISILFYDNIVYKKINELEFNYKITLNFNYHMGVIYCDELEFI